MKKILVGLAQKKPLFSTCPRSVSFFQRKSGAIFFKEKSGLPKSPFYGRIRIKKKHT